MYFGESTGFRCKILPPFSCSEFNHRVVCFGPTLWSSGQTSSLQTQRFRVLFPALTDFLSSSGSGTGSTQPL
jgi:hypothetical protein